MLKLNIDAVEFREMCRYFLDVGIRQPLDPRMRAAKKILVEIENPDIHAALQLAFQGPGVSGDSAELIIGADDGDPRAPLHQMARRPGFRSDMHSRRVPVCLCSATQGR
ncbi:MULTISPECIES: hypothetical protein [Roseomonadaceae]|uniref:Uncharacterized protein n=1 Tax=Falsiroseomonas oleicola TaxID=2801474 RepID=A0ABS6HGW3_9PROT|nr:hypothetical protein [Roseomonas oleicola]MBU8546972.1 hypothetical protein [Roseomonas oleicola]